MKLLIYTMMIIGVLAFTHQAFADSRHHPDTPNINISSSDNGTALAIAISQSSTDWATNRLQGSLGVGYYDNESAISFGLGKKYGDILINGSIGMGSEVGGGVGLNFRF